jgi:hypothetical protein
MAGAAARRRAMSPLGMSDIPTDAVERATVRFLSRPGTGWATASLVASAIGRHRLEVGAALGRLAALGQAERRIEWADRQVVALWRFSGRSR